MVILAKSVVHSPSMCFHIAMQIKTSRIPKILHVGTETFNKDPFGIIDVLAKVNSTWCQRMKDILTCPWGWKWLSKPDWA